jgi:hypothetical protein
MVGYIFLCDGNTESECLERLLFGTNNQRVFDKTFCNIEIGDNLFLYNYELGTLRGPFKALTRCEKDLDKNAWKDSNSKGFPYQVRVSDSIEFPKPLNIDDIKSILSFTNNYPQSKINDSILQPLWHKFENINNFAHPIEFTTDIPLTTNEQSFTSHYIFKCDRVTGGRVFHENLLGAPLNIFKDIVSKIQEGDYLFVWLIEERKLYGIWKAISRGQFNPYAFPETGNKFPAVVYCNRTLNLEKGLDETAVRSIVPFDGNFPPYRLKYEQGLKLIEEFESTTKLSSFPQVESSSEIGKYLTEDGHFVRSHGELIIDNWLFRNNILHAYEYRIQKGMNFVKCDFYLPQYEIFIEYWGMIGNSNYNSRRKEKVQFYNKANLKLLELFPVDVTMLSEVLRPKLAAYGVKF